MNGTMNSAVTSSKKSTTAVSASDSKGSSTESPKIFWSLWHPKKTWVDILIGFFVSFLLPPFKLPKKAFVLVKKAKAEDDDSVLTAQELRHARLQHALSLRSNMSVIEKGATRNKSGGFYKWSQYAGCDIVEAKVEIKRNDRIFHDWGILDPTDEYIPDYSLFPKSKDVTMYVAFPVTILPRSINVPANKNEFGCLVLECNDVLNHLSKDIPLVVFFHGGGLTVGSPRFAERLDLISVGLDDTIKEKQAIEPLIYVSAQYSLSPEHPFPVAPIETCSVISYLLDLGFSLHVSGNSAGGYLALVSGLEAYRAHPKKSRICSVVAMCPMLNPSTDSLSFYQNQASSHACPVHYLRWSYRSYLELSESTDHIISTEESDLFSLLGRNSTRIEWRQSKWYSSKLRRLVEPYIDIPDAIGQDPNAPTFIVTTNQADPLHDGGVAMIDALRAVRATVIHCDDRGSHWIGTVTDPVAHRHLAISARELARVQTK
jgi:acetyl esterase/lipase